MKKVIISAIICLIMISACATSNQSCLYAEKNICNAKQGDTVYFEKITVNDKTSTEFYASVQGWYENDKASVIFIGGENSEDLLRHDSRISVNVTGELIKFNEEGEAVFEVIEFSEDKESKESIKYIDELTEKNNVKYTVISAEEAGNSFNVKIILNKKEVTEYKLKEIADAFFVGKRDDYNYNLWFYHESEKELLDGLPYSIAMIERNVDETEYKITMK